MSNTAENTFDAGQFISEAAKNAADLYGTPVEATAVRIVKVTTEGKMFAFNVLIDVTVEGESIDQALLSQIGAFAAGAAFILAFAEAGPILAVAAIGAGISYGIDKLIDALYDWSGKFDITRSIFTTASTIAQRRDPIFTDLNGDGVKTIGVDAGAYFDHDANGFAEQTGWVSPDDGLLVRDINNDGVINNGRELFGDNTLLKDGSLATDGLQALADLDSNNDNKIDSADAAFSQLKVWKDVNSDGISQSSELKTLSDLGIKSLNTTYTVTNITDSTGNTQTHQATYETIDGMIHQMGNFLVQRDTAYTKPTETLPVPEGDISLLPDLRAYGNVYDLQQAMIRDESGQLKALVVKFIGTTNAADRTLLMDQILFKWTGSDVERELVLC